MPLIREIGFLVIFVAAIFAVAWYLPKIRPSLVGHSERTPLETVDAMAKQINSLTEEIGPYRARLAEQKGYEDKWLRPVIEWIDVKSQTLATNELMCKFQIDSGLVYDFKPSRMWIKPILGEYVPKQDFEIIPVPNLLAGKRSQLPSQTFLVQDEGLLKRMHSIKSGGEMRQELKIIIELSHGDNPKTVEPTYPLTPY